MTSTPELPIHRWPSIRRKIPYGRIGVGYYVNPDDAYELLPILDHVRLCEEAFDFIDSGNSYREVCEWLSQKLSRSIVHQTISNLYARHRKPFLNKKTNRRVGRKRSKEEVAVSNARLAATRAAKKASKISEEYKQKKLTSEDYINPPPPKEDPSIRLPHLRPENYEELLADRPAPVPEGPNYNWVFTPNPGPQSYFLSAPQQEILYGGAAGGGKSYAMLADPMRFFNNGNFVGLLLRRTNDELRELKWESQKLYPQIWPKAVWKEKDSMWVFPSGAKFWMTYLERDEDVMRYQGQAFSWIGVDELTQYATPFAWNYLKSRLRSSDPELQKTLRMRATTNPGGPGHQWVKKMFVDPAPPGQPFWATDVETNAILTYPDDYKDPEKRGKPLFKRCFIPARLSDNPYLHNDGTYERGLLGLPEEQRKKLLEGSWDIMEGAAFPEFSSSIHVIDPREIPNSWRRFRCADFGYSSHSCVLWIAIDPNTEQLVVYKELYVTGKTGKELSQIVYQKEKEANDRVSYGVLDSSLWHQRGQWGPSIAEEMIAEGTRWKPSDRGHGSRTAGFNRLHELLKVDPTYGPGIVFFNNCRQIISDLPMLPRDPDGADDIDDRYRSDHSYDALRYGIMSRPKSGDDFGMSQPLYAPADRRFGY